MEKKCGYFINTESDNRVISDALDTWLMIKSIVIAGANVLFYNRPLFAYTLIAFELVILFYDAVNEKWTDYFGNYILFCGLSLEFTQLTVVTRLYSFKEFRILGINLGVLTLLPIAFIALRTFFINGIEFREEAVWTFSKHYVLIIFISWFMSIVMVVINDNNINRLSPVRIMIEELYERGFQPILMIIIFIFLSEYFREDINRLSDYLLAALIGVVFSLFASLLSSTFGYYGGVSTLLACVNIRWIPILLLFPAYNQYKGKHILLVLGLIGTFLILQYNATGKTLIVCVMIPFVYLIMSIIEHKYERALLWLLVIPLFIIATVFVVETLRNSSVLFNSKFKQVLSLMDFFGRSTEASDVASSPRIRIYEIINITKEYLKKPYFILFGKGLGGTMLAGDMEYTPHAFTRLEWENGLFFNVHETLAKLYLSNGLYGIWFYLYVVVNGIKRAMKTPWIIIGLYWFVISFGYSITMTALGFSCLLYGFYASETEHSN